MVKNTYGSGRFMLMNTGAMPVQSRNQLVTSIAGHSNNQTITRSKGASYRRPKAIDRTFEPRMPVAQRGKLRAAWNKALGRAKGWINS
jgi:glycerol kinase